MHGQPTCAQELTFRNSSGMSRARGGEVPSMSAIRTDAEARFTKAGAPGQTRRANAVLARLDRIDAWSLPYLFIGIIGLGFLFTFYDIFDINVSFIQSCV